MAASQMALPNAVVTRADVGRLAKEAETLDSALNAASVRGNGAELPKTTQLLTETAGINKLNLLQAEDRKTLLEFLQKTRANAPTLHMSFNSDPSPTFQQGLITWVRREINPAILLQIGLNPSIGAGCVVRTTNKFFDFSLKRRFTEQRELLIAKLNGDEATATAQPSEAEADLEQALPVVTTEPVEAPVATPAVETPVAVTSVEPVLETPEASEAQPSTSAKTDSAAEIAVEVKL